MANTNDEKKAGAAGAAGTGKGKGAKKSNPQLPVAGAQPGNNGGEPRVSPAAVVSMVGKSIKDLLGGKKGPSIPGLPKLGGGGRTSNGEKPKLLAIFFVVYAQWTKFARLVANGMVKNIFVDGAAQTKENRVCYVVSPDGNVAEQCAWSAIAAWFKANHNFTCTLNERGALVLPQGWGIMPVTTTDEKASTKLASFRKNADLSEHFAKLATETSDAEKKADYEGLATYYGNADKYDGFACATPENAVKLAEAVRGFYAMNPEIRVDFTELETWSPVFGQDDMNDMANAHWPNTSEAKAAAAEPAEEAAQA